MSYPQSPQPMYQPGSQNQPSGGFPTPQAPPPGGFGAPSPYGTPYPSSSGPNPYWGGQQTALGTLPAAVWTTVTLAGLAGLFGLIAGIAVMRTSAIVGVVTLLMVVIAGLWIVGALAAGKGQEWGRIMVTVLCGLGIIGGIVNVATGATAQLVSVLVAGVIVTLWWLPSTTQGMRAKAGAVAPMAGGGYGAPFGQPGQPGQFPQSGFGQPGQPGQFPQAGQPSGGFAPFGQQPPQPPQW